MRRSYTDELARATTAVIKEAREAIACAASVDGYSRSPEAPAGLNPHPMVPRSDQDHKTSKTTRRSQDGRPTIKWQPTSRPAHFWNTVLCLSHPCWRTSGPLSVGLRRSFWCSLRLALRLGLVDLWERALERRRGLAMVAERPLGGARVGCGWVKMVREEGRGSGDTLLLKRNFNRRWPWRWRRRAEGQGGGAAVAC